MCLDRYLLLGAREGHGLPRSPGARVWQEPCESCRALVLDVDRARHLGLRHSSRLLVVLVVGGSSSLSAASAGAVPPGTRLGLELVLVGAP